MRLLLDTHTLLWWLDGDRRLSRKAKALLSNAENDVLVSAASAWEIATKARLGKLPGATEVAADVGRCLAAQGFGTLDITVRHAQSAGSLASDHRDPFDRMLAAQTQLDHLPIVSNDTIFDTFGIPRLW